MNLPAPSPLEPQFFSQNPLHFSDVATTSLQGSVEEVWRLLRGRILEISWRLVRSLRMAGVEGRGSAAGHLAVVMMVLVVGLLAMAPTSLAVNHVVGGTQKWTIPTSNTYYDTTWSPSETFTVGDTLQFEYTSAHNVVQYNSKSEYDACAGTPVKTWTSGNDTISLTASGTFFYICSVGTHCGSGMKVSVNVGAAATPPATTPSPPASTTPPPPAVPSPPPPSGSSAASSGPVLSMAYLVVAALVAALAFLVGDSLDYIPAC